MFVYCDRIIDGWEKPNLHILLGLAKIAFDSWNKIVSFFTDEAHGMHGAQGFFSPSERKKEQTKLQQKGKKLKTLRVYTRARIRLVHGGIAAVILEATSEIN